MATQTPVRIARWISLLVAGAFAPGVMAGPMNLSEFRGFPNDCHLPIENVASPSKLGEVMHQVAAISCDKAPDTNSPAPTTEVLKPVVFGIFTGGSRSGEMMAEINRRVEKANIENSGCDEGCERDNHVHVTILTTPTTVDKTTSCGETYKPVVLTADELKAESSPEEDGAVSLDSFHAITRRITARGKVENCQKLASEWVQQTLRGKTRLGEYLDSKHCSGSCSFSSGLRLTNVRIEEKGGQPACSMEAHLVVLCGPPKADFEWKSEVTLVNDWGCRLKAGAL